MGTVIKVTVLVTIAVLVIIYAISKIIFDKGKQGERKVASVLKKYAKKHDCKVINGIYLPLYKGTCEVDHLIFGKFGVAVIETKNISGVISGSGKNLVQKIGSKKHTLYNPQMQNKTHVDNVAHHLKKAGFSNPSIYSFVVFSNDDVSVSKDIGISLDALPDKIKKLPDNKCNYEGMYSAILDAEVTSLVKIFFHKFQKHKKS